MGASDPPNIKNTNSTQSLDLQKIRLRLAFEGTHYKGWQKQKSDPTVQQTLEAALQSYFDLGQPVSCTACGRTDAGVHAEDMQVHFHVPASAWAKRSQEESFLQKGLAQSVNSFLPRDIRLLQAWLAPEEFHARESCEKKIYRYQVLNTPIGSPFLRHSTYHLRQPVSLDRLNELSQGLVGLHDFKSFQTAGTPVKSTTRQIHRAQWSPHPHLPHVLCFHIEGEGFLKQMVRNILGTLLHLEKLGAGPEELAAIFEAQDRQKAHGTAPAHGLFLERVFYGPHLDRLCVKI